MLHRSFSSWSALTIVMVIALCNDPRIASAQGLFGSGGTTAQTGSSSFGGSAGLVPSSNSASGFTSQFGGTNQAGGQAGNLNTGGLGQQTTGLAGPALNTELGALSDTIGQGGFVGGMDTAGRFVGSQQAGQQSIQAALGGLTGGQFGNRGSNFNQQNNFNNRQGGTQSRRVVRPRLQIAFNHTRPATTAVQTNLNTQFRRFQTSRPELENVQIQVGSDRNVVLRGRVNTENDKKLAAMLARLEPGVRKVKNELTIEGN